VRHAVQPQQVLPETGIVDQLGHMVYLVDGVQEPPRF